MGTFLGGEGWEVDVEMEIEALDWRCFFRRIVHFGA